ncbi:glycerate kinase [Cellulomonas sp. APG4]|uniref:glycerate kinase family protein n=1 Tax=Cellulomonas sp. APG4 TaxID=1538656 RepID=UPI00137AE3EE|nr:glycerate kinase [Cellulomonas sp. APG4]
MRILVAPDCFGGTLTAPQAADAMVVGWRAGAPHDEIATLPLADGGPGFLDAIHQGLGGDLHPVTVPGPLGEPTVAAVLVTGSPSGPVAYLESAQAVGLHLVPPARRDPTRTSSAGLGHLLRAALELGARRVVVGLGGSATNDAGAGMLAALRPGDDALVDGGLADGGGALGQVRAEQLAGLAQLRDDLAHVDLVAAVDVDVPLLGLHGASAGFAAQKGASPEQAQALERDLGHFAHLVLGVLGPGARAGTGGLRLPLADGGPTTRDLLQLPGAGAAGGLGFALAALGARVLPGAQVVADAVGLARQVADADLVLTGEGTLDWQSLHGKVVHAVAQHGLEHGVPVVAVAGQVYAGRREWSAAGLAGVYAVAERPEDVDASLADPAGTLTARVARVARTWSR